uniref:Uncharacterized protein n=1 Tax=Rhizophora mucronata TaxID=61149 RepID=A0A2P2P6U0_RHIMU
MQSIKYAVKNV